MFENWRNKLFSDEEDEATRRRIQAKKDRLAESAQRPILPGLSTAFFLMTLGSAVCTLVGETGIWLKYGYETEKYLQNLSFSLLGFWLIFGFVTIVLSAARFYALRFKGAAPVKPMTHSSPRWNFVRKRVETPQRYATRCLAVLGGLIVLFIFYALVWLV